MADERNVTANEANINTNGPIRPDSIDAESVLGRFGWQTIELYHLPFVIRVINGEHLKFVSVRMAETQLFKKYLQYLHVDVYKCTLVRSRGITKSEAYLLNDINRKHCDEIYGKNEFVTGRDTIVRLEDVHEFYLFMKVCYKLLTNNFACGHKEKCGFITINSEDVMPYYIKDDKKYVLFDFLEGDTDDIRHLTINLKNWDIAYLKFCLKVQGIQDKLFDSNTLLVISLDDIKKHFPPDFTFEDYKPTKMINEKFLINQNSIHVDLPGISNNTPCTLGLNNPSISEKTVQRPPLPSPLPTIPLPSMSMGINSYQNGSPLNQLNSAMFEQNNSNNPISMQSPPLVRSGGITKTHSVRKSKSTQHQLMMPQNYYTGQHTISSGQMNQQQQKQAVLRHQYNQSVDTIAKRQSTNREWAELNMVEASNRQRNDNISINLHPGIMTSVVAARSYPYTAGSNDRLNAGAGPYHSPQQILHYRNSSNNPPPPYPPCN